MLKSSDIFREQVDGLIIGRPVKMEVINEMTYSAFHPPFSCQCLDHVSVMQMSLTQLWTLIYHTGYLTETVDACISLSIPHLIFLPDRFQLMPSTTPLAMTMTTMTTTTTTTTPAMMTTSTTAATLAMTMSSWTAERKSQSAYPTVKFGGCFARGFTVTLPHAWRGTL